MDCKVIFDEDYPVAVTKPKKTIPIVIAISVCVLFLGFIFYTIITFIQMIPAEIKLVYYGQSEVVAATRGKTLDIPESPEPKVGYEFEGWYLDANLTTKYDFDLIVNDDFSLYAKFKKKNFSVIFRDDDTIFETMSVVFTESFIVPEIMSNFNTDLVSGWNTKSDGTGRTYALGSLIETMPAANVVLYAMYN